MQATKFLKEEHGKAKAAFQEIEAAPAPRRGALWTKLRPELELHEQMEEKHLYGPVAREVQVDRAFADWESAHHREVQEAEGSIREIDGLDADGPKWLATVKKLRGALEQHIREEEQEIWPKIEQVWDAQPARGSRAPDGRDEARGDGRRALSFLRVPSSANIWRHDSKTLDARDWRRGRGSPAGHGGARTAVVSATPSRGAVRPEGPNEGDPAWTARPPGDGHGPDVGPR